MIEQQYPEPTVGALIFNQAGELLVVRSHKWRGKFTIPGGHVEVGESLEDAVRREVMEETGLTLKAVKFLCFQEFIADEAFWEERHFIFFDFACWTDDDQVVLNEEAQEYRWMPVHQVEELLIGKYLKHSLEIYLADGIPTEGDGGC